MSLLQGFGPGGMGGMGGPGGMPGMGGMGGMPGMGGMGGMGGVRIHTCFFCAWLYIDSIMPVTELKQFSSDCHS